MNESKNFSSLIKGNLLKFHENFNFDLGKILNKDLCVDDITILF